MMDENQARIRVELFLKERATGAGGQLVVLDDMTLRKAYGWIFFYDSKNHVESGDIKDAIGGNGPLVIIADTGELIPLGTARSPETEIARFEEARRLP